MLCAVKRPRDGPDADSPMQGADPSSCSPHRAMVLESPASKRTRSLNLEPAGPPSTHISPFCGAAPGGAHRTSTPCIATRAYRRALAPRRAQREREREWEGAPPTLLQPPACAPACWLTAGPACCRAGAGACDAGLSATLRQRIDPHTGEVLFALDQVKDIVRRAVDEKERCLREQYDRILQEKLQEQFRAFSKFNEDYISRSLKSGDLSYCS